MCPPLVSFRQAVVEVAVVCSVGTPVQLGVGG